MTNEEIVKNIQQGENVQENITVLYNQNIKLIKCIAYKYKGYAEIEDLIQEGFIGMFQASLKYEFENETKFSTYCTIWLKQKMLSYIAERGSIRLPRNLYWNCRKYVKILNKKDSMTDNEVLEKLNISENELETYKSACNVLNVNSIDEKIKKSEGSDNLSLIDTIQSSENIEEKIIDQMEKEDNSKILWEQVDKIGGIRTTIIKMKYQDGKTLEEISRKTKISKSAIIEYEKQALLLLKRNTEIINIYGIMAVKESRTKNRVNRMKKEKNINIKELKKLAI